MIDEETWEVHCLDSESHRVEQTWHRGYAMLLGRVLHGHGLNDVVVMNRATGETPFVALVERVPSSRKPMESPVLRTLRRLASAEKEARK